MTQTTTKRKAIFAPTIWRATITRIVILLLCVPTTWAAIICNCQPEMESRHVCCHTKQAAKLSETKHQNHAGDKASLPCKNTQSPSSNSQMRKSSQHAQHAMNCCEASPQSDLENAQTALTTELWPHPEFRRNLAAGIGSQK